MAKLSPAQIAEMRRTHIGVHREKEIITNDTAIYATREIAAWVRTLERLPDTPEEMAAMIESEFVKSVSTNQSPEASKT